MKKLLETIGILVIVSLMYLLGLGVRSLDTSTATKDGYVVERESPCEL